ncbi:Protein TPR1 [Zea mays]|uniref:Protein TPR1 n=1 Tax=Zea mays TaxID=4577 RepID=A0A3L6DP76_MAIZE|nr:Protein TPR1 [Zea mays]
MSSLTRDIVFLVLQFLDEEKFKETMHKFEQESGFFFNMKYFEAKGHAGDWDEVEKYLSGFTKIDDNNYSMKIFFEIRKQKYLEALDRHDGAKALDILVKDLKVFSTFNEESYKEITQLLTFENFRVDAVRRVTEAYKGRRLMVGVDDVDLFKGIGLKYLVMEQLLVEHRELRGRAVLVQIANPARSEGRDMQGVQDEARAISGFSAWVNVRFGTPGYTSIVLIDGPVTSQEKAAYYAAVECCLLSAVRDRLNWIPYIYMVCRQESTALGDDAPKRSAIVLSEFIGCSPSLSGAIRVNPWSVESVAEAMNVALRMPEAEQRLRHEKHYKYVSTHNVAYWTRSFDSDLQHACKDHFSRRHWGIGFGMSFKVVALSPNFRRLSVEHIVPSYQRTENRLILLDYDSTVMSENSIDRTPSSEVISVLNRLCEDPKNRVFIVSGRGKDELSRWFTPLREAGHRGGARLLHKQWYPQILAGAGHWSRARRIMPVALAECSRAALAKSDQHAKAEATGVGENEQLSNYGDTKSARTVILVELKKLIKANPLLQEKLVFPTLKASRLRTLINQSLNWQHQHCKNPRPNPDIKTLFTDHTCTLPNGAPASRPLQLPPPSPSLARWLTNTAVPSSVQSAVVAASSIPVPPNQVVSMLKRPTITDYQSAVPEQLMKRLRPGGHGIGENAVVKDPPMSINRVTWSPHGELIGVAFTKYLIRVYAYQPPNETRHVLEIVAHSGGVNDIAFSRPNKQLCVVTCGDDKLIKVWNMHGQKLFTFEGHKAPVYSICAHHKQSIQGLWLWSFYCDYGIQYSDMPIQVEKREFIFSTSLDGKIKAWLYDNVGSRVDYEAPGKWCTTLLYSADGTRLFSCGTSKEGDSYLVQWNENDGSIKRTYSGFRKRSAGVAGVVQFDIAQNHILAAGEDNKIKFWDVDNNNMLICTDAEGGLPALPRLRFNKEGNLLAVTTVDNGFKILANADGLRNLRALGSRPPFEAFRLQYEDASMKVSGAPVVATISPNIGRMDHLDRNSPAKPSPMLTGGDTASRSIDIKARISEEKSDKAKASELMEVLNPQQCRVATMPETPDQARKPVHRLASLIEAEPVLQSEEVAGDVEGQPHPAVAHALRRPDLAVPGLVALWGSARRPQHRLQSLGVEAVTVAGKEVMVHVVALIQMRARWRHGEASRIWVWEFLADAEMVRVRVVRLLYTNSGVGLLALGSNAIQRLWKWSRNEQNPSGKATASVVPHHWQPNSGLVMTNDTSDTNPEEAIPCIALSKNDSYVMSASGGKVSLFTMMTFKISRRFNHASFMQVLTTFMPPPPASTFLAFHPQDNNIIAIGMEDSTIHIYDVRVDKVKTELKGHQKRITGLAFSTNLGVLVSSGADAQWIPQDTLSASISHASYSCNSQLVFSAFIDGNIGVFDAENLRLRCRIAQSVINSNPHVHPLVVAAHPHEPNQFAVGLSDGFVKVLEPLESEGKWGTPAPVTNGTPNGKTPASSTTSNPATDQIQR